MGGNKIKQREENGNFMQFIDLYGRATLPEFFQNFKDFPIELLSFPGLSGVEVKFLQFPVETL